MILITILVAYALIVAFMYFFQRRLMYFPETLLHAPAHYNLTQFTLFNTEARDGTKLMGWQVPASANMPTLIYFHGNAANLGWRSEKYAAFAKAGFGAVAISYRGYGTSGGKPSEAGIYQDARAAIDYALQELKLPLSSLILYGESLGTGVAIQMASEYVVAGLVLEAPYLSVQQRSSELYPYLPVKYILRDRYLSVEKLPKIKMPLLILHGEKDIVIPVRHGKKLLEIANEPKRGVFYEGIGHTDFDPDDLAKELTSFAAEYNIRS